jgi:hypothetical protein
LLVRIFFFVAQSAKFFPEFNIRLDDKNSELHYFFFLHQHVNVTVLNLQTPKGECAIVLNMQTVKSEYELLLQIIKSECEIVINIQTPKCEYDLNLQTL